MPFLLMSASNHRVYQMERVNDTLSRIEGAVFDFAPRLSEQFDAALEQNVGLFLDTHLLKKGAVPEPKLPQLKAETTGGKLRCRLTTPREDIEEAKVYYAVNQANPAVRDWREADLSEGECVLPLFEGEETVFLYPRVRFRNGYTLSGKLTVLTELASVAREPFAASQVLYTSAMGTDTFTTFSELASAPVGRGVFLKEGAFKISGICDPRNRLATYKVNDARFRFHVDTLNFDICSRQAQSVYVVIYENFNTAGEVRYVAEVQALGGDMWQPVTLSAKEFKSETSSLRSFGEVSLLVFATESEALFNNILWV